MAMGNSANAASATVGFAARKCLVRLTGRTDNPTHSAASDFNFIAIPLRLGMAQTCLAHLSLLLHFALLLVASSTVQHLQFKVPFLTASALKRSAGSTSIGLVASLFDPFHRYASPLLTGGAANACRNPCTHDDSTHLVLHSIPYGVPVLSLHSGVLVLRSWAYSCRCRHFVLPCYRSTAHRRKYERLD